MRLGILSDTHDEVKRAGIAVRRLVEAGASALVHCGDITNPDVVYACADLPVSFVFGNCDHDQAPLEAAIGAIGGRSLGRGGELSLGGKLIAVTHGDSSAWVRKLLAGRPDYLLYGHTHRQDDRREGETRLINPGALHRAGAYSVALLNLEDDSLEILVVP